jgi:DNA repair exonuclease SbcCD ATPase subunit
MKYLKNQYVNIEAQVEKLVADKSKVETRQFVVDMDAMKEEYDQRLNEYKDSKDELSEISKGLANYSKIIEILSDTGVKSYIFDQLIPVLTKSVNYYLNIFELPIYIEFDNTMKDSIKTSANFNSSVSYLSFSEGEKKKIDMAILLSFIDVTKKIANWNCNLLIIDELLDSSIDDNGLEKMLESLEKMVLTDTDMGIYIISHRFKTEYKHFFNSMIEIKKNSDGFSKIHDI